MAEFLQEAGDAVTQATNEWGQFLSDPKGRAALMSFGLAMMQPVAPGQSSLGHFGQAIGNAAGSLQEEEARELKAEDVASKGEAREARAWGVGQRAIAEQERLGNYRARTELAAKGQELSREKGLRQAWNEARREYGRRKDAHERLKPMGSKGESYPAFPDIETYMKSDPVNARLWETFMGGGGGGGSQGAEGATLPAAAAPVSQGAPGGYLQEGKHYRNPETGQGFTYRNGQKVYD